MAFTLAAAMLVGMPMSASAAGLVDLYSISDGSGNESGNKETPTQTVTNTDSETSSVSSTLDVNEGKILGITLDQSYVTAVVDKNMPEEKRQKITATVVLDGFADTDEGRDQETAVRKALNKKIKWEVFHYDESKGKKGAYFPSEILSIKSDASNRSVVILNPRNANNMKTGEEMIVRASIDGRYYYQFTRDENGNIVTDENGKMQTTLQVLDGKEYAYKADARVFVKEYSDELWFDWNQNGQKDSTDTYTDNAGTPIDAYYKHTVDMNKYLARSPKTANDAITWTSTNKQAATVTAAGVVTFKSKKDAAGQIIAVSEKGHRVAWDFTLDPGTPASKIEINEVGEDGKSRPVADKDHKPKKNVVELDAGKKELLSKNFTVTMYAKVEAAVAKDKVDNKEVPATSEENALKRNEKYVVKKFDLRDGTEYLTWNKDKTGLINAKVNVTDKLEWTSNKPAFAVVTGVQDKDRSSENIFEASAKVEARGLGKASITVKASNGKKASFTADVKATMGGLEILGVKSPSYSGQSIPLTAKKLAFSAVDDENHKIEIQNKDAVKWYIAKGGTGDDKYDEVSKSTPEGKALLKNVKISNKGVLTISNKLDADHLEDIYVGLKTTKTADKLNGVEDNKKPYYAEPQKIVLKQSSIDSIYINDGDVRIAYVTTSYNNNGTSKFEKNKANKLSSKSAITASTTINVPKGKTYTVDAVNSDTTAGYEAGTTLSWKTSNAKVVDFEPSEDGKGIRITAKAKGKATMTVSGINVDKSNKQNAKVISTTFTINVEQPATSLTLKKTEIVMKPKNNASVSVAAVLNPKGFKKTNVKWQWQQTAGSKITGLQTVMKGNTQNPVTAANASVKLGNVSAGDVFEITASIPSGYSAKCVVKVVKDTKKLALVSDYTTSSGEISVGTDQWITGQAWNKGTKTIDLGQPVTMKPLIDLGTTNVPEFHVPGTDSTEGTISYTVNKKDIVNIVKNDDGTVTVYPVGYGKVTITAKTALNKSAKVTIEVKPAQ